jgi:hypothetical protein
MSEIDTVDVPDGLIAAFIDAVVRDSRRTSMEIAYDRPSPPPRKPVKQDPNEAKQRERKR